MHLMKQYDVLEKEIKQNFEQCGDSGATLFVRRRDIYLWIVVNFATKIAIVRCNKTGKRIAKKHWNTETKSDAKQLLSEHKTPVLGKYLFYTFLTILLSVVVVNIFQEISQAKEYKASFLAKSAVEKTAILSKLGKNDLVYIGNSIYRIETIKEDSIIISKSNIPLPAKTSPYEEIQADLYPESSFDSPIEVDKQDFYNSMVSLGDSGYLIMQVLDR